MVVEPDFSGQLITDDDSAAITLSTDDHRSIQISSSLMELDYNLQGIALRCDSDGETVQFSYGL